MEKIMTEKDMFLQTWDREFATTLKVLKAYPAGKDDFKPAEKSNSAKALVWTFVGEQQIAMAAVSGGVDFSKGFPEMPQGTVADMIAMLEKSRAEALAKIKSTPDADLNKTTKWFVAPKQMGDVRIMDVLWMTVMDMVHHRGQFSVYLRLVGAKVPSIYGPTADEPWM